LSAWTQDRPQPQAPCRHNHALQQPTTADPLRRVTPQIGERQPAANRGAYVLTQRAPRLHSQIARKRTATLARRWQHAAPSSSPLSIDPRDAQKNPLAFFCGADNGERQLLNILLSKLLLLLLPLTFLSWHSRQARPQEARYKTSSRPGRRPSRNGASSAMASPLPRSVSEADQRASSPRAGATNSVSDGYFFASSSSSGSCVRPGRRYARALPRDSGHDGIKVVVQTARVTLLAPVRPPPSRGSRSTDPASRIHSPIITASSRATDCPHQTSHPAGRAQRPPPIFIGVTVRGCTPEFLQEALAPTACRTMAILAAADPSRFLVFTTTPCSSARAATCLNNNNNAAAAAARTSPPKAHFHPLAAGEGPALK